MSFILKIDLMVSLVIRWNVDPEIFSLGPLSVRWYGLLFAFSFVVGYLIFQRIFKREGIKEEVLDSLTVYMALGVIIGARLGHVLFYDPQYYFSNPIKIFKIWEGGLASHGASIGILIALYYFSKKHRKTFLWIMDRIVIVVALAGAMIRTGNLMNSEIYGVQTDLPWGFIFVRAGEMVPKHPTQIYEALAYLLLFVLLFFLYQKKLPKLKEGQLFGIFLIILFTARFFIEYIKEDQSDFEAGMALNMGQILSIPFIIGGFIILWYSGKKNKPAYVETEKSQKRKK